MTDTPTTAMPTIKVRRQERTNLYACSCGWTLLPELRYGAISLHLQARHGLSWSRTPPAPTCGRRNGNAYSKEKRSREWN